ncbi:hypothetical protein G6F40_017936 [Rhizopus arrhizus]|nr:hypothetical protein G6F40_017936 [Rhizopus arrhizus]
MPRWVQFNAVAGLRCVELQHVQFDQRGHGNGGPGGLRPIAAAESLVGDNTCSMSALRFFAGSSPKAPSSSAKRAC